MPRQSRIEAPEKARDTIKLACETGDNMIFHKKTSDYLLRKKWKRKEVIRSIIEHADSGYKIFLKLYNNPHARPQYGYQGSLKHYAVTINDAVNDLRNKTSYMEIKGHDKPTDIPFMLLMHQHDSVEILPII